MQMTWLDNLYIFFLNFLASGLMVIIMGIVGLVIIWIILCGMVPFTDLYKSIHKHEKHIDIDAGEE